MANDLSARMRLARLMGGGGGDSDGIRPVRRTSGTAVSDSAGGKVTVRLSDGDPIEVPTSVAVKAGDTVSLLVSGGVATAVGVAGWGDEVEGGISAAKSAAEKAQADADAHEEEIAAVKQDVASFKSTASATYATKTEVDDKTGAITKTLEADYLKASDASTTYATKTELTEDVNQLTSTMTSNYSDFTNYKTSNDAEIASMKTTYATKSDLSATDTELSGKVSDALTTAKSYTDSSITTEVTNRDAAIKAQADSISLEVSKTYTKQETFSAYQSTNDAEVAAAKSTADDAYSRTLRIELVSVPADAAGDTSQLTAYVYRGGELLSDQDVARMGLLAWYVGGSRVATGGTYACAAGTAVECRLEA